MDLQKFYDVRNLNAVLDGMNVPTFVIDAEHKILFWNNALEQMTGIPEEDVMGTSNQWRGFYPDVRSTLADLVIDKIKDIPKSLYGHIQPSRYVKNGLHSEGWLEVNNELRYVIFDAVPVTDDAGNILAAVETLQDITEHKNAVSNLELSAKVINAMAEGVIVTDPDGNIISINDAFSKITGYDISCVIGKSVALLESNHYSPGLVTVFEALDNKNNVWEGEIWNARPDGSSYPCQAHISVISDAEQNVLHKVCVFSDISKSKEYEERIQKLAHYDFLTGLPNRLLLSARLQNAIDNASRNHKKFGLVFIDLDRFKNINDTLGHAFGDEILKIIANRLKSAVRQTDTVARLGGDEFVVLIVDANSENDLSHVANTLVEVVSKPCTINNHEISMYPSAGIAVYPTDGLDADALMRKADTAMYHAKANGGRGYQFYAEQLNDKAFEVMFMESSLKKAIVSNDFKLYLQPQIDMTTNEICGSEALLRWRHENMGMMPPARFIPVAEEAGLIVPIGNWVIDEACRLAKELEKRGGIGLPVAINISAVQMERTNLVELISESLAKHSLPASAIEMEVTESALMADVDKAIMILKNIGKLGVSIAIDDFGTGYSSLSRLKNFPLKKLKVDRSFVKDVETDTDDAEICKAIISLAQNLNLKVVAEGVETKGQELFLQKAGCHIYQGYYSSPPIPEHEFFEFILKGFSTVP